MTPCGGCGNFRDGDYTLDQCRLCWLAHNDPAYGALWGTPEQRRAAKPRVALGVNQH